MIARRSLAPALLALAVLSGPALAQEPIKIGVVNPFTGPLALYGDEMTRGFDLAVERANQEGGIGGRKLVIVRGSAVSAQEGIAAVEQLVGREKVDLLMGTYVSAISNAASESALNNNKLFWETNALARDLTDRGLPNFVRAGPSGNEFATRSIQGTLDLVAKQLGKAPKDLKVWIEHEDSSYGTSIAKEQEAQLKKAGVQVSLGSHSARAVDLTDSILRAKNAAPDLWLSTAYVIDHNLLLRTAREQGFKPAAMMLVGTGDTFETLDAVGKEFLDGVLLVSYPRADIGEAYGPGAAKFLEAYKAKYGREPIAPQALNAYVGARILVEALKAAKSTEYEKVVAAAAKMDQPAGTYETGYGAKFDDKMQNVRALPVIAQWQDGKVVAVYPKEAASSGTQLRALARK